MTTTREVFRMKLQELKLRKQLKNILTGAWNKSKQARRKKRKTHTYQKSQKQLDKLRKEYLAAGLEKVRTWERFLELGMRSFGCGGG